MKQIHLLLFLMLSLLFQACDYEDETIDPTVMPAATHEGRNTFGCLINGWVYVGGRFWKESLPIDSYKRPFDFYYDSSTKKMSVSVLLTPYKELKFMINDPQINHTSTITEVTWDDKKLNDGEAMITTFDRVESIISGTFHNDYITNGRFDVYYKESNRE